MSNNNAIADTAVTMNQPSAHLDLAELTELELFTLWLCLHADKSKEQVLAQLQPMLGSAFLSPQTMAQRWREDVYRQLMHKGMATEQRPAKPGFADYLFCLLSKVPDVETHYAKELALLESIIQHPEKYQNNPTIIQHWLEPPIH
ncbi:hypothetical protein CWC09_12880 [Pseudoalteromonas ruthenica]|nr:hypothetical protein CWC09_12880 [Pseudoalteromonas ruthenica]